ncbi:carbohydrate kinase family protein [Chloroflexota bacterium]
MSNIEVVGLGALNIDHIYKVERILDDGEAVVNRTISSPGGSAANTVYGLAKLGVSAGFIGAIGDDAEGKILLQDFQKVGADISHIGTRRGARTGSVLCLSDQLGKRSLYVIPGANNQLTTDDLDLTYINQAQMLHITSFVDEQQLKLLLELMIKLDFPVEVSFSPGALYASKGLPTLTPLLARTHVLFLNESEMRQLTGEDFNSGAQRCLDLGCHIAVVTLGKGASYKNTIAASYIRTAGGEYLIEPSDKSIIPASDTVGAGDAFAAGFLYGLIKGEGLEKCGRLGDIVARFSITKTGARQGLPTFNQLAQRYRELYSEQL